jgi:hypothetical protein
MSTGAVKRQSWLALIASFGSMFGLLYCWKVVGDQNAGNLFLFMAWIASAASFCSGFITPGATDSIHVRTRYQDDFSNFYTAAMVAVLAYFGMFWLAAAWMFAKASQHVYRQRFDADGRAKNPT